jgi:hypothetical protein
MSVIGSTGRSRKGRIRVYRSAALTTGSSGTFVVLPWDAEHSTPTKYGFTHSTSSNAENITCGIGGECRLVGALKFASGTWDEIRASVEVNTIAVHTPQIGASAGVLGLVSGPNTLILDCPLWLARDDVVRIRIASVGQSNVPLDVGDTDTWVALLSS